MRNGSSRLPMRFTGGYVPTIGTLKAEVQTMIAENREIVGRAPRVIARLKAARAARRLAAVPDAPRRFTVTASTDDIDVYGNRIFQPGLELPADGRVDVFLGHEPAKIGRALITRSEHQSTADIELDDTPLGREAAKLWAAGELWGASLEYWPLEVHRNRDDTATISRARLLGLALTSRPGNAQCRAARAGEAPDLLENNLARELKDYLERNLGRRL